ncbi:hypothetical protein SK128_004826 [Halocaridina rubra]|uniref:Uncharacterized protein n=1 Tax=Halocaridina rubra TaxID=373956 RepID=A0AAN8WH44_HALRR
MPKCSGIVTTRKERNFFSQKDTDMAPDSQCVTQTSVETMPAFVNRVLALPALDQAASIYRNTKDQQYVGTALKLAEAAGVTVVSATGSAVKPIATPIANHVVGGWAAVDAIACRWLDNMEKAMPIITKPPDEIVSDTRKIVSDTRNFVMTSLAGQPLSEEPTLKAAIATRASGIVVRASSSNYGRAITDMADSFLYSAHIAVDTYLPPEEGDLHHSDGVEGSIGTKAMSLASKTQARLRRSAQHLFEYHVESNEDEVVIYPLHMHENGNFLNSHWNENCSGNTYMDTVLNVVSMGGEMVGQTISVAANTVGLGYFFVSQKMKTLNSLVIASAGATFTIISTSADTFCSTISPVMAMLNNYMTLTIYTTKSAAKNVVCTVYGAGFSAVSVIQSRGAMVMRAASTFVQRSAESLNTVQYHAINSLTHMKNTGADNIRNLAPILPDPMTKMIHRTQNQLVSISNGISSESLTKVSRVAFQLPGRIPHATFHLLSNNYVLIHVQIWVVDFQRRLAALVKNGTPKENGRVLSESTRETAKLFASALN